MQELAQAIGTEEKHVATKNMLPFQLGDGELVDVA
jgi:hypothetical protein